MQWNGCVPAACTPKGRAGDTYHRQSIADHQRRRCPAVLEGTSGNMFSDMALAGRVEATARECAESPQRSLGGPITGSPLPSSVY